MNWKTALKGLDSPPGATSWQQLKTYPDRVKICLLIFKCLSACQREGPVRFRLGMEGLASGILVLFLCLTEALKAAPSLFFNSWKGGIYVVSPCQLLSASVSRWELSHTAGALDFFMSQYTVFWQQPRGPPLGTWL